MTPKESATMSEMTLQSPLAPILGAGPRALQVDGHAVALGECPLMDMLNLRGNPQDAAFTAAVAAVTGLVLPLQANTATLGAGRTMLWLGPDEWMLQCEAGQAAALEKSLRAALSGQHFSVVEVGHGFTTLSVQGPGAAALLSRGCPLDFHHTTFQAGQMAQTHIARANAIVLCRDAGQDYLLTVRRSFADYLFRWLSAAAGA
jgi:sarcosine oxidase subunit gamma